MENKERLPALSELLKSPQVSALMKNRQAITELMQSQDGQRLLQMVGGDGQAQQTRDPSEIAARLGALMKTPEGAELISRIQGNLPK